MAAFGLAKVDGSLCNLKRKHNNCALSELTRHWPWRSGCREHASLMMRNAKASLLFILSEQILHKLPDESSFVDCAVWWRNRSCQGNLLFRRLLARVSDFGVAFQISRKFKLSAFSWAIAFDFPPVSALRVWGPRVHIPVSRLVVSSFSCIYSYGRKFTYNIHVIVTTSSPVTSSNSFYSVVEWLIQHTSSIFTFSLKFKSDHLV